MSTCSTDVDERYKDLLREEDIEELDFDFNIQNPNKIYWENLHNSSDEKIIYSNNVEKSLVDLTTYKLESWNEVVITEPSLFIDSHKKLLITSDVLRSYYHVGYTSYSIIEAIIMTHTNQL